MPYDKGDFTQQGINGDVSALVRLNEKRIMKVVLSSDDESDNCDISGKVYDLLNGASYDIGSGGGGGEGFGTLLLTQDLGAVATESETRETIGNLDAIDVTDYDMLLVVIKADTQTTGHLLTARPVWLTASTDRSTKSGNVIPTATLNMYKNGNNIVVNSSTTASGVYVTSGGYSGNNLTLPVSKKYSPTYTTAINNNYHAYVYGFSLL